MENSMYINASVFADLPYEINLPANIMSIEKATSHREIATNLSYK